MNLVLLGATGRVGRQWMKLALQDGHHVTTLVRTPEKIDVTNERLTIIQGDVRNPNDLLQAAEGADAVISAIGTDGADVLTASVAHIIAAMRTHGIRRIITIGTAGILDSTAEPGKLRYQSSESRRTLTRAAEEHHKFYLALAQSGLDWTIVCPTYLPDGEYIGTYRVAKNVLPADGTSISVPDTAAFAHRQLVSPEFLHARVGIAY